MQNIIGLFQRVKRQIVINVLYVVVIKIISIDIGKPDGIGPALGKKVLDNIKQPAYNYSTLASMDSDLPAANKEPPLNYYYRKIQLDFTPPTVSQTNLASFPANSVS